MKSTDTTPTHIETVPVTYYEDVVVKGEPELTLVLNGAEAAFLATVLGSRNTQMNDGVHARYSDENSPNDRINTHLFRAANNFCQNHGLDDARRKSRLYNAEKARFDHLFATGKDRI
jgi:hypothetical protein